MGVFNKVSLGSLFSALVLILAVVYYRKNSDEEIERRLQRILDGLLKAEKGVRVNRQSKIAIAFGSCQDLIVKSSELLKHFPEPTSAVHHDVITDQESFLEAFSYFYRHGAAAERFVSNTSFFAEIAQISKQAPSTRYHIGGNAAIMARRFALEGAHVLLGAHMSKELRNQLPPDVQVSGPTVEVDDAHLLLEYASGEQWGQFKAPRANRFIVHNDHENPKLSSLSGFAKSLPEFQPDLVVLGGMQMMDNFPFKEGERDATIEKVRDVLKTLDVKIPVHFEMASYVDVSLLHSLAEKILPFADSLGMNEQELPNLHSLLQYGNVSLVSDSYPRVATVLDQMRDVYRMLHHKWDSSSGSRPLSRLHIHTLAFQAIMTTIEVPEKNTNRFANWKNTLSSAAKAALTAHRHTCGSHHIDVARAKVIMDDSFTTSREGGTRIPFNEKNPVRCWTEQILPGHKVEICVAPVLVCTRVLQTGGGGDNVSAAGLVLQV